MGNGPFSTFDRDQIFEILDQMSIGQAFANSQIQYRIHLRFQKKIQQSFGGNLC